MRSHCLSEYLATLLLLIYVLCVIYCSLTAVGAFFAMGTLVGASMLDRLWLLGGLLMAWWASGAVHRDTRGGTLVVSLLVAGHPPPFT